MNPQQSSADFQKLCQALFAPRSIALIGQSGNPNRPSGRPLKYLRRDGFSGNIYPINARRETVQGERAYASLADLPERPDHAFILLDTEPALASFKDCCRLGVPVIQVLADGFAEAGEDGAARQRELVELARAADVRLLGPNCMGVADLNSGLSLTVNATFEEGIERGGRVALISQSGSMMGGLMTRAAGLGVKFSKIAAVGNEADLGVGEIGRMLVADPDTDVILLFLETIRNPDAIASFALAAHEAGKPIIAYKLGRSTVGQELAVAHTGALLSEDSLADAFFKDLGIVRVTMLEALIEAAPLCRGRKPLARARPKVGVITTTGGGGAAACDQLAHVGVDLLTPSDATVEKIRATGIDVHQGPMTDVTLAGARAEVIGPSLSAMADDPGCDVVLCVLGSSARATPKTALAPVIASNVGGKPLAAFLVPDAPVGLKMLIDAGIPAFRTPETCADALKAYCAWAPPRVSNILRSPANGVVRMLDEHASLEFLARQGVSTTPGVVVSLDDIGATELPFPYPVAAKVVSDEIAHKTEVGGVVIGIQSKAELTAAASRIRASVAATHPHVTVDSVLVEAMASGIQEVLVGYHHDAQVGPVVTVAPGGITVGLYPDKSVRLAPVTHDIALSMVEDLIGLAPLRGHRGQAGGDVSALADIVVAMSELASCDAGRVVEAEINPVVVSHSGAVAVDALVRLATDAPAASKPC